MWQKFLRNSAYGILGLPMAVLWASVIVPLVATSGSLLIVGVGFVLFAVTLRVAIAGGAAERWLLSEVLDVHIPQPTFQRPKRVPLLSPLDDAAYWRALGFLLLRTVTGSLNAVAVVVAWLGPLALFIVSIAIEGTEWGFLPLLLSPLLALLAPLILRGFSYAHIALARSLLGPGREQLIEEADTAALHRDLSVEAAEAERRRIERDLHDGAQARLATVALDLGRAKRKLEQGDADPEVAAIVDSAHADAKAAIVELRNLARGIHPAVLTDRGLDAALSEVAARCTVPVHLDVRLQQRPPAHIESAAYFAASELLANITKHSNAKHAWVTVRSNPQCLYLDVSDDGIGGADPTIGSGLDGLHDRITGLGGLCSVRSPLGNGTAALVELPLHGTDA